VRNDVAISTTYTYDNAGQLTQTARRGGSIIKNSYWPDGQLKTQVNGANTNILAYTHDPAGRLATTTDALNRVTTFGYDRAGQQVTKADPGGTCPTGSVGYGCTRLAYTDGGQLAAMTYSDGTTPAVSYSYNTAGAKTTMQNASGTTTYKRGATTLGAVGYTPDAKGRLTAETRTSLPGGSQTFGHSPLDQLTTIGGTATFTHSTADNLTKNSSLATHNLRVASVGNASMECLDGGPWQSCATSTANASLSVAGFGLQQLSGKLAQSAIDMRFAALSASRFGDYSAAMTLERAGTALSIGLLLGVSGLAMDFITNVSGFLPPWFARGC
jgi:YD repeat-containing protein